MEKKIFIKAPFFSFLFWAYKYSQFIGSLNSEYYEYIEAELPNHTLSGLCSAATTATVKHRIQFIEMKNEKNVVVSSSPGPSQCGSGGEEEKERYGGKTSAIGRRSSFSSLSLSPRNTSSKYDFVKVYTLIKRLES